MRRFFREFSLSDPMLNQFAVRLGGELEKDDQ
jgi:hypothetical protein